MLNALKLAWKNKNYFLQANLISILGFIIIGIYLWIIGGVIQMDNLIISATQSIIGKLALLIIIFTIYVLIPCIIYAEMKKRVLNLMYFMVGDKFKIEYKKLLYHSITFLSLIFIIYILIEYLGAGLTNWAIWPFILFVGLICFFYFIIFHTSQLSMNKKFRIIFTKNELKTTIFGILTFIIVNSLFIGIIYEFPTLTNQSIVFLIIVLVNLKTLNILNLSYILNQYTN